MGVKIEVRKTGWADAEGKYGYATADDDLSQYAKTRRLETDEIKSKLSNSSTVAATRGGSQSQQRETAR